MHVFSVRKKNSTFKKKASNKKTNKIHYITRVAGVYKTQKYLNKLTQYSKESRENSCKPPIQWLRTIEMCTRLVVESLRGGNVYTIQNNTPNKSHATNTFKQKTLCLLEVFFYIRSGQ